MSTDDPRPRPRRSETGPGPDPMSRSLPLEPGLVGDAVRDLQIRLRLVGVRDAPDVSGRFDDATSVAVTTFQVTSGLEPTGICDHPTWSALVESGFALGDRLLYHRIPMLRGDDVAFLQRRLGELGFLSGRVDGIFGPETEAAVRSFQRNTALVTDGVAGPDVVAQLRRLGPGSGTVTKAVLTERLALLAAPNDLAGARVAVGEPGTVPALVHNVTARLDANGAMSLAIHHPDGSATAGEANRFDARCFVGCTSRVEPGAVLSYYETTGFASAGGRHLAEILAIHLETSDIPGRVSIRGMRIPVLRETRMPALWCEIGTPAWLVEHGSKVATGITTAVTEWIACPLDEHE
ncbi:MAG: peptidoglycan-binding protein [Actinobacteria bacterium]|nr:peptidoglycan-binding protein [Actinomycetota bacterium]